MEISVDSDTGDLILDVVDAMRLAVRNTIMIFGKIPSVTPGASDTDGLGKFSRQSESNGLKSRLDSVLRNTVVSGNFREGNEFREIQKDGIVEGLHLWKRVTDVLLRCGGMWRMVCQTPESLMTHPVEPQ